ncbi:hypothetical protein LINPERHAP2_LOCUS3377 [Linum perenne]
MLVATSSMSGKMSTIMLCIKLSTSNFTGPIESFLHCIGFFQRCLMMQEFQ